MQSNKKTKGLAIPSRDNTIRERSLKLYSYLICRANLRNEPNKFGDNVRIFQQKNLNLTEIKRILGFEERTTKKYLESLEEEGLIIFKPHDWKEKVYTEQGDKVPFTERWKIRNKHKDTYYEIPVNNSQLFRKIPKETLVELNEICGVNELTMKIYIILVNLQEVCVYENINYKKFTYQDIRDILGYQGNSKTNQKIAASLQILKAFGLIDIEVGSYTNSKGAKIQCFVLNQANFYVSYDFKCLEIDDEAVIDQKIEKQIVENMKATYPLAFS